MKQSAKQAGVMAGAGCERSTAGSAKANQGRQHSCSPIMGVETSLKRSSPAPLGWEQQCRSGGRQQRAKVAKEAGQWLGTLHRTADL